MSETTQCNVPPAGWWCSREAGHDGPCAARPVDTEGDGLCPDCGMDPLDRRGEGEWCPTCATPSLPSGSVEPMTEERYGPLVDVPYEGEELATFLRLYREREPRGRHKATLLALADRALRSSAGDEAGRRLREAAQAVVDSAYQGGHYTGVSANALYDLSEVLATLSSSGTTETRQHTKYT